MELKDFQEKNYFTPFELEHILQLPLSDIVQLFSEVPRVPEPRGCFQGEPCRALIAKWARKRVYADVIARNAANARPTIRRGDDAGEPMEIALVDTCNDHRLTVRFPGDLRNYVDRVNRP
ncbi:MAG: hypothetical protein WC314_01945 [Vulcanimicrobiota bacterium]